MLPPKPQPKTHRPPPDQLPAMAARFAFSPEIKAAKLIVEHWISHTDSHDRLSGMTLEATLQVQALVAQTALTLRQRQVLDLFADGHSQRAIAVTLDIERSSVRNHIGRSLAKIRGAVDAN